jgi:hypothetical protein
MPKPTKGCSAREEEEEEERYKYGQGQLDEYCSNGDTVAALQRQGPLVHHFTANAKGGLVSARLCPPDGREISFKGHFPYDDSKITMTGSGDWVHVFS